MKISHDPKVDVAYLELEKGEYEASQELKGGVIVDVAKDGKILGFEIYGATKKIPHFINELKKGKTNSKEVSIAQ